MFQIVPCVIANISWKFHENPLIDFTMVMLTNMPGAPRWENVKQSRQVWNSLTNYFLFHAWRFIKILWNSVHPFFHNITNKHGSRKQINRPRIQGVNLNIPKMFQVAPCVMSVLFWKFHENLFNRFSAMLLRGMDWSEKVEKKSCVQGVKRNILKILPIVPCIESHLPWKFHENPFSRFSVMLLTDRQTDRQIDRQTDRQTSNGQRWKHNLRHGGGNETHERQSSYGHLH